MVNLLSVVTGNCVAIIILIILSTNLPYSATGHGAKEKAFLLSALIISIGALGDMASAFMDGLDISWAYKMNYIMGIIGVIAPVAVGYAFLLFVELSLNEQMGYINKRFALYSIPLLFTVFMTGINMLWPIVFTIAPGNYYTRGPLGLLAYGPGGLYLLAIVIRIITAKKANIAFLFVSVTGFLFPMLIAAGIQFFIYGIFQAWVGFAISLVALFSGMQRDYLYTDIMTEAKNRVFLEYFVSLCEKKQLPLGGLLLDIDHFKSINDAFGHRVGDEAIKDAVVLLKNACKDKAHVIRMGGDEFAIIFSDATEESLQRMKESIIEESNRFNLSLVRPYELEFSIGCSIYLPGKTSPNDWKRDMDMKMYEEKNVHRMERREKKELVDATSTNEGA